MKVLFLDVDGVLNCANTSERFKNGLGVSHFHLAKLKRFLSEVPDVHVVLSSSWRLYPDMLDHVKSHVTIFDVTPDSWNSLARNDVSAEGRGLEISDWLKEHPEVSRYAILDDDNDFLPKQRDNLFRTKWESGLTDEIVDAVIHHFRKA